MERTAIMPLEFDSRFDTRAHHSLMSSYIPDDCIKSMEVTKITRGMGAQKYGVILPETFKLEVTGEGYKFSSFPVFFDVENHRDALSLASRVYRLGLISLGEPTQRKILNAKGARLTFEEIGEERVVVYSGVSFPSSLVVPQDWISQDEYDKINRIFVQFFTSQWCIRIDAKHPSRSEIITAIASLAILPAGRELLFMLDQKVKRVFDVVYKSGCFHFNYGKQLLVIDGKFSRVHATLDPKTGHLKSFWSKFASMVAHELLHVVVETLEKETKEKRSFSHDVLCRSAKYDETARKYVADVGPFLPVFTNLEEQEVIMGVKRVIEGKVVKTFHLSENLIRFQGGERLRFGHCRFTEAEYIAKSVMHLREADVLGEFVVARNKLLIALLKMDYNSIPNLAKKMMGNEYMFALYHVLTLDNPALSNLTIIKYGFYKGVTENTLSLAHVELFMETLLTTLLRKRNDKVCRMFEFIVSLNLMTNFKTRSARGVASKALASPIPWKNEKVITSVLRYFSGEGQGTRA